MNIARVTDTKVHKKSVVTQAKLRIEGGKEFVGENTNAI